MTLSDLKGIIENYSDFIELKKANKDISLTAVFSIIENGKIETSLDYKLNENKICSFSLVNGKIVIKQEEIFDKSKKLGILDLSKVVIDEKIILDIMNKELLKNNIKNEIEKIIAVLSGEKPKWSLTCLCKGFIIISSILNPYTGELQSFEKKSMFDFARVIKK